MKDTYWLPEMATRYMHERSETNLNPVAKNMANQAFDQGPRNGTPNSNSQHPARQSRIRPSKFLALHKNI